MLAARTHFIYLLISEVMSTGRAQKVTNQHVERAMQFHRPTMGEGVCKGVRAMLLANRHRLFNSHLQAVKLVASSSAR